MKLRRVLGGLAAALVVGVFSPQAASAVSEGAAFVAISPTRIVNASGTGTGAFTAGETRTYTVPSSVPSGAEAIVIDVAVTSTTATGLSAVTAWKAGTARPTASTMQVSSSNAPQSNTAIVPLSSSGMWSLYNSSGTSTLNVDLQGYFIPDDTGAGYVPIAPTRYVRTNGGVDVGPNVPQTKVAPGATVEFDIGGLGEVPVNASAVFANVQTRNATGAGTLRLGPGGTTLSANPGADYGASGPRDTGLTVRLASNGRIKMINSASGAPVDVVVDVVGYFIPGDGTGFHPVNPVNIVSTGSSDPVLEPGETRVYTIAGKQGVPADGSVAAVALTVQARNWSAGGNLNVYNPSRALPHTSTVNFSAGLNDPTNGASSTTMVELSSTGEIAIRNDSLGTTNTQIAIQGWFLYSEGELAVRDAMERVSTGTGTASDVEVLEVAGVADQVVDGSQPVDVVAIDEDEIASVPLEGAEQVAQTGDAIEPTDPSCDAGSDPLCVTGVTTESPAGDPGGAGEVEPAASVPGCPAGHTARRYTVTLELKGATTAVIYAWYHRIHYCTRSGKVTKWRGRYDGLSRSSAVVYVRKLTLNKYSASGGSSAWSHLQRRIDLCVVRYGCYDANYPWSILTVTGTGGKSYKGRSS